MNFSQALYFLKRGERVARSGWNGKDMFLFLVPGSTFKVNRPPLLGIYPEGTEVQYHAHIDMKTAQGYVVPWLASQSDILSDDWEIVMSEHNIEELEEASKEYFAEEAEIIRQVEDKRTAEEIQEEVRAVLQKLADYQTAHETGFTEKFDYKKLEIDGKILSVEKGRIDPETVEEIERIRNELTLQQTQEVMNQIYETFEKNFPGEYEKEDFLLGIRPGEESLFDHSFDSPEAIDELEVIRILQEQNKSLPQTIGEIVKQTKDNMK